MLDVTRALGLGVVVSAMVVSACGDPDGGAPTDAGGSASDGASRDAGGEAATDAGSDVSDAASMDGGTTVSDCLARSAECDRRGVDFGFQCDIDSRRTCIAGAATCAELSACYLGPTPPPDGGWTDDALAELACQHTCGACEPLGTRCDAACAEAARRDCVGAARTCAAVDACF